MQQIFIGTSGFNYPDWKGKFYPRNLAASKWLPYYAHEFQTVEMNATFYGTFKPETYGKWASGTPDEFRFSIKGSRFITHVKRLKEIDESLKRQVATAKALGEKLHVFLWQFPETYHLTKENRRRIESFLELLPRKKKHAFEFRHASWFVDEMVRLIAKHNGTIVLNDTDAFPVIGKQNGAFVYIRFHGPAGLYSSSYSQKELFTWARRIASWQKDHEVYAYFNNDVSGYAIVNAQTLISYLH